jgi:hypothetical protein
MQGLDVAKREISLLFSTPIIKNKSYPEISFGLKIKGLIGKKLHLVSVVVIDLILWYTFIKFEI